MVLFAGPSKQKPVRVTVGKQPSAKERACERRDSERFHRNQRWLFDHWNQLQTEHPGMFVAVASERPFVGTTVKEAVAKAVAVYPEEDTVLICKRMQTDDRKYIRIYAYLRRVDAIR